MDIENYVQAQVEGIRMSPYNQGFMVVLSNENRWLPISIGSFEAQSIAIKLEDHDTPRPLSHTLMKKIVEKTGTVKRVMVTKIKNQTFYADIIFEVNGEEKRIDARSSDAIALAIRMENVPVYVHTDVMDEVAVYKEPEDDLEDHDTRRRKVLEHRLQKAIKDEEYEKAAEIRDKLDEIDNS